jgi:hypothetical protein
MTNDVTAQHPDYAAALPKWQKAEDAVAGEDAVKAKGDDYLPRPNPTDKSAANQKRFEQYLARAVYYNATGRTLKGLLGLAFDKDPQLKLPSAIAAAQEDVTGSGVSLFQHMQGTLAGVLKCGRAGLLVDFPKVDFAISKQDEKNGGVRPTLTYYRASAVTNWATSRVAGKTVLSLVVLLETHETRDGFAVKREPQYRVLRLDSTYRVELWRKVKVDTQEMWVKVEESSPLTGAGAAWTEIPFTFVGSETNDSSIDDGPLYDIATLNLAHYRNSADYEDSAYFCGQPQVWMAGLSVEWVEMLEKKGVYFGSRALLPLPVNASAGIMQAEPNTLAKEAMDGKEGQMAALGARLIQAGSAVKTATQQDSEDTVAHSVLSLAAENTSASYRICMGWYAIFANAGDGDIDVTLSNDYTKSTIDAQMLTALVAAVQAGKLPLSDFWAKLRAVGLIAADKTDDDLREEVESDQPLGGADGALDDEAGGPAKAA